VPGWHQKAQVAVGNDQLQELAIATEQYGDRMALFMQWKEMTFPTLLDPLNVMAVKAVPILLLVDEHGIIQFRNPSDEEFEEFLTKNYPAPQTAQETAPLNPRLKAALAALQSGKPYQIAEAIQDYQKHTAENPDDAAVFFRLGVLLRHRYDSESRQDGDFQNAVLAWSKALAQNPSQYIWRRRIQQYGPQLDKPYPFYNWVTTAREEIKARGAVPLPLTTEPSGSEMASPTKEAATRKNDQLYPAAGGDIPSGEEAVTLETTLIPHTSREGRDGSYRLHLRVTPQQAHHWTSDAQEASLWLLLDGQGPQLLTRDITKLPADQEISTSARILESGISAEEAEKGQLALFYYICSDTPPVCSFLQSTIELSLPASE
jgi:tetratricopeptide (TPR) repeat protein